MQASSRYQRYRLLSSVVVTEHECFVSNASLGCGGSSTTSNRGVDHQNFSVHLKVTEENNGLTTAWVRRPFYQQSFCLAWCRTWDLSPEDWMSLSTRIPSHRLRDAVVENHCFVWLKCPHYCLIRGFSWFHLTVTRSLSHVVHLNLTAVCFHRNTVSLKEVAQPANAALRSLCPRDTANSFFWENRAT